MTESHLQESIDAEVEHDIASVGAQLYARRHQLNWTVEDVANQLNLAPRQIEALEANDFGALPGIAIARGFIRAYAKLLKMDATPLLAAVAKETTPADELIPLRRALPSKPFSDHSLALAGKRRWLTWPVMLLALAGLLLAAVLAQRAGWLQIPISVPASMLDHLPSATNQMQQTVVAQFVPGTPGAESTLPMVSSLTGDIVPMATMSAATSERTESSTAVENASVSALAAAVPVAIETEADATQAVSAADDVLLLKMREDSWLEIRRPDNSIVLSGLIRAGNDQAVKIVQPLALTIGNASGVDASLRGTPIDLASAARSNVARLTLQ